MKYRALLCWVSAISLSALPHWPLVQVDTEIQICAFLDTEGGYTGRDVLGLGFGAMATLLPLALVVLAVAVRRSSPQRRRILTWMGAGGALATSAYYALSTVAFFEPYCPVGTQGVWLVLPLYGAVAVFVLIAGTPGVEDRSKADTEWRS
ncbi:hypothetical protein GCM10010412_055710 [Nonomuraea recticatena]|uniref:Uncharacterized protein n=1 Tax=Nonomuraea recticatena TaxID=46178 RepID=A0ABN3SFW7_9ACTN